MPSNRMAQSTDMFLLNASQAYLQALCKRKAPDSFLAEAWNEFYRVYSDLIRRFAIKQGLRSADLDDCVQDVWSTVASNLAHFEYRENRSGLRAWLYTLVRSKAVDLLRQKKTPVCQEPGAGGQGRQRSSPERLGPCGT